MYSKIYNNIYMSHLTHKKILQTRDCYSTSRRSLKFDLYKDEDGIYFLSYKLNLKKLLNYELVAQDYKLTYMIDNQDNITVSHYEQFKKHTIIVRPIYLIKKNSCKIKKFKLVKKKFNYFKSNTNTVISFD